jgi:hypothetical protein
MAMLIPILLACALAQDAPQTKVPDAALFDELIRKTNELKAFVAVYRMRSSDQEEEGSIRITFRAPDEMMCEFVGVGVFCGREGSLEVRMSPPQGKSMVASVPFAEQSNERWSRFTTVMRAEFPTGSSDWPANMSYGTQVGMSITPLGEGTKEEFQFSVQYGIPRTAVLEWLERFKAWTGTRSEDDEHVVFRTSRGADVSLSKRTGFIDSIHKKSQDGELSFELKTLDLDPKLDDHAFDLPHAPVDASDVSAEFAAQMQQVTTIGLRRAVFAWISRLVTDGKMEWNAEVRTHVRKALEALHSDAINTENEPWISETKKWIESTGNWMRERYVDWAKADEAARGELEAKTQEARTRLFNRLQALLKSRAANLEIQATLVPDATLRSSLLDLERNALEAALEHSLQGPLLESFDAQVQRAKSGG